MKKIARSVLLLITLFIVGDVVTPMVASAQYYRHRRYHRRYYRHHYNRRHWR